MSSVCIHGLGYIGLPTAAMLANHRHQVSGYDDDQEVRAGLQNGNIHIDEPGLRAFVTQALESGQLEIVDEVVHSKYQIICVPTPFDEETKEAKLDYVTSAGKAIVPYLREGDTVILESTVPPGTTVGELKPILEQSGLVAGDDFALVHCPETVLPGNIITELQQNSRIIGGVNGVSTESAVRIYESFVEGTIRTVSDPTTAEFVKLIQNTFRDTNIALANEIAKLANDYGVDSRTAIDLANEHPRVDFLWPGPGVGGHCLPIDPWFLGQESDSLNLIAKAREVNDGMVDYVVEILRDELGTLDEKKISILGVAYKGNVDDTRRSPGLRLARELQTVSKPGMDTMADGGTRPTVVLNDPHVVDQTLSLESLSEVLTDADAAVITADHDEYSELNPSMLNSKMQQPFILDTKGILEPERWYRSEASFRRI